MGDYVCVFRAAHLIEAHCYKGLLQHQGIECHLVGEALNGAMGEIPFIETEIQLLVFHTQKNRASAIIEQAEQAKYSTSEDWQCSHCGELNSASFELCWHCSEEKSEEKQITQSKPVL